MGLQWFERHRDEGLLTATDAVASDLRTAILYHVKQDAEQSGVAINERIRVVWDADKLDSYRLGVARGSFKLLTRAAYDVEPFAWPVATSRGMITETAWAWLNTCQRVRREAGSNGGTRATAAHQPTPP